MWCVFQVMCDGYMAGQVVATVTRASNTWTVINGSKYQKKTAKRFQYKTCFLKTAWEDPCSKQAKGVWCFDLFFFSYPVLLNTLIEGCVKIVSWIISWRAWEGTLTEPPGLAAGLAAGLLTAQPAYAGGVRGPEGDFFWDFQTVNWMNLWFGWEVVGIILPSRRQYVPGIAVYTGNWVIVLPTTFYKKSEISIDSAKRKFHLATIDFQGIY